MIVLMAGLPGTGKTTLARELAARTAGRVISKDDVRHALFRDDEIEYSTRQDDFCLGVMLQLAGEILERDRKRIVFLDGRPFSRGYQIDNVVNKAAGLHQGWQILECVCSEETARQRLQADVVKGTHSARNRDFKLYETARVGFEAIVDAKTIIDTDQPFEHCISQALSALAYLRE
jgi:predicted kinase